MPTSFMVILCGPSGEGAAAFFKPPCRSHDARPRQETRIAVVVMTGAGQLQMVPTALSAKVLSDSVSSQPLSTNTPQPALPCTVEKDSFSLPRVPI